MKYRKIEKVVDAIKNEIPSDPEKFRDRDALIRDLDKIVKDSAYRAPELYYLNFELVSKRLNYWLGAPDNVWKINILDIFADRVKIKDMDYFNY